VRRVDGNRKYQEKQPKQKTDPVPGTRIPDTGGVQHRLYVEVDGHRQDHRGECQDVNDPSALLHELGHAAGKHNDQQRGEYDPEEKRAQRCKVRQSSAPLAKFVRHRGTLLHELRKQKGALATL